MWVYKYLFEAKIISKKEPVFSFCPEVYNLHSQSCVGNESELERQGRVGLAKQRSRMRTLLRGNRVELTQRERSQVC